jgi:uncharacterized membrane protein HdeD (DUF308 family)
MSQATTIDRGSGLGRIGRTWQWMLAYGIISVLVGLLAVFFPGATLLAIAIIFGAQLVVAGIFQFVAAFAVPVESGWLRALTAVMAILAIVVGIYCLRQPILSILILALILGLFWVISGVIELFVGIGHPELPGRAFVIASGILSIVAGAIVFFLPGISLLVLTLVLGIWLVVHGVMVSVRAFQLRSARQSTSGAATRPVATS